jgi:uncharacterized membrane protein
MLVATPSTATSLHVSQNAPSVSRLAATPDFSLSANPASLTISPGATLTSTITASSLNGFVGTIYLATFSYPLLVSLETTSLILPSGGTAGTVLTVSAPSTILPGNETIFVDAAGGCSLVHLTTISARVTGPDFVVTTQKSRITMAQGASGTSRIDLASRNGFAGSVSLLASSYPVTSSVLPGSVTLASGGVGTATLTVNAPLNAEPGNYTVFMIASSGKLTHYLFVDVTVTGPTFAISAHQEFLTLLAGGLTNSSTITVSPVGGLSGTVTLSPPSSYPPGLTVALAPTSVPLPGTATLTVGAPLGTKTGYYLVDVTGMSGTITKSASVFVTVKGPDFDISPDPFFLIVVAGGPSCTSTISVAPINGFQGSISLTKKADPALTTTLSANTVLVPGTSTLTVSAPLGAKPGFYSVEINGSSASPALWHTTHVSVVVIGPDFNLSANPPALTVTAGSSASTSMISMTAELGFSGIVGLTASSFEVGITTSLSQPSISGASTSILSVSAATGTVPGSYYSVEVNGTSGSLTHSIFIPVTVVGPDFTLSSNPASISFNAGTPTTSTITITPTLGFTGTVNLNAFSSSSNLNASISPTTVTSGSYTTTLNVNSTIPGVYTVDVFATSGGLFHDLTISVIVAGPDFALSAGASALTIAAGSSKTSTVAVSPINGFTGSVALTVSSPAGITATLSPTSIISPQTSTLAITVDPATSPGPYIIDVQGTSGKLIHDALVTVNVVLAQDFTISAGAVSPAAILTGNSGSSSITVTSVGGFVGPVSFSASAPSPAGLSCQPIPSWSGTGTATLTCSATVAGDYTITVTGTAGTLTHTTGTILFHLVDFSIAAGTVSPTQILAGSSGTSTITATALNGLTGTIALAASASAPAGLTCTLPASVTFGTSQQTATLSCSATAAGDYTVTVTGTATIGGLQAHHVTGSILFHIVGFSIAASPTTIPVSTNAAGTSTITIAKLNQFSGVVSLSTNNSACTLSSTTITGSGTSTLSCTFTSTGTKTVTITGLSGSLSLTATVTFTVNAVTTPNFTIAATTPASFTSGGSSTSTVTVTAHNSFYNNVDLTYTVSPGSGLSVSFNPNSFAYGSGTSTATFSSSTPGTYTVTITGKSGSLSNSATVTVTVNAVPQPTAPATTTILGLDPTLFYSLVGGIVAIVIVGSAVVLIRGKKPQSNN